MLSHVEKLTILFGLSPFLTFTIFNLIFTLITGLKYCPPHIQKKIMNFLQAEFSCFLEKSVSHHIFSRMLCDAGGATESGLSLLADASQELLDFGDGSARIESLGAGLGAVHDGVTPVDGEGITELVQPLAGGVITGVNHPAVGLHQHGGTEVLVAVPPIRRARGGTTSAQNTFVKTVKF